jgi:tetratricopeptide (TPR) repeat protein
MAGYSAQEVTKMLGLSPARLRAYVRAGFLSAERGEHGRLRFSFQDLLLLRTAEGLVAERIPPRRVADAFRKLRQRLPDARPLTGLQLTADGNQVVVRDGGARWQPESGQVLLDFSDGPAPSPAGAPIATLEPRARERAAPTPPPANAAGEPPATPAGDDGPSDTDATADELYHIACALEESDPGAAISALRSLLAVAPGHADARIELGRLLHEAGDLAAAETEYRLALKARPDDATAAFNLGVAIEDQGRIDEALGFYARAVALDPRHPDAHYNAARLFEKTGQYAAAVRHLRTYRDLTRGPRGER